MRWTAIISLACAGFIFGGCGRPAPPPGEILFRHHFSGLGSIGSRSDLRGVQEVLNLPESQSLLDEIARKLAADLPTWFGGAPLGTNDTAALKPVVRQMLDGDSFLEVRAGPGGQLTDWALAVRIASGPTLALAGTELRRILGAPAVGGSAAAGESGFEATVGPGKVRARFASGAGWMVLGRGAGVFDSLVSFARAGASPWPGATNAVLEVTADVPKIARLLNWRERPPGPVDQWPILNLTVEPRTGRLRTSARMDFAQVLNLPSDPWQIPTNVLRDPLVGFTAAQGAGTWIGRLGLFSELGVKEWPRQLFLWSLAGQPWLQYFAAPMQAPTNLMAQVSLTIPARVVTNMLWNGALFSLRITNQATRVQLYGIPYFSPFMESQLTPGREQLFGGLFPHSPTGGRPAPSGLLAQVEGRTNLVLYDWETTGRRVLFTNTSPADGPPVVTNAIGRLVQFKEISQFVRLMLSKDALHLPTTKTGELLIPGSAWIDRALPLLGDTVTEVTRTGPAQLTLMRQSQTGFNALELIYLLRWFENPAFPGWSDEPVPAPVPRRAPPGATNASARAVPVAPHAAPAVPLPARPKPAANR